MKLKEGSWVVLISKKKFNKTDWSHAYNKIPGQIGKIDTDYMGKPTGLRPYQIYFMPWISGSPRHSNSANFSRKEFTVVSRKQAVAAGLRWEKKLGEK